MVTSRPAPAYLLRDGSFPSYNSHHSGDEPLAKRCSGKGPAHALCCWWEPRSRVGRDPVGAGQSAELYAWSTHKCSQSPEGKPSPAAAHAIKPPHIFLKRISGLWMMGWKYLTYIQPRGPNQFTLHSSLVSLLVLQLLQHKAPGVSLSPSRKDKHIAQQSTPYLRVYNTQEV